MSTNYKGKGEHIKCLNDRLSLPRHVCNLSSDFFEPASWRLIDLERLRAATKHQLGSGILLVIIIIIILIIILIIGIYLLRPSKIQNQQQTMDVGLNVP